MDDILTKNGRLVLISLRGGDKKEGLTKKCLERRKGKYNCTYAREKIDDIYQTRRM